MSKNFSVQDKEALLAYTDDLLPKGFREGALKSTLSAVDHVTYRTLYLCS
jgi:hypothetical protein